MHKCGGYNAQRPHWSKQRVSFYTIWTQWQDQWSRTICYENNIPRWPFFPLIGQGPNSVALPKKRRTTWLVMWGIERAIWVFLSQNLVVKDQRTKWLTATHQLIDVFVYCQSTHSKNIRSWVFALRRPLTDTLPHCLEGNSGWTSEEKTAGHNIKPENICEKHHAMQTYTEY